MKTVRGKLEGMLIELGMFDSQAKEVMELAIPKLNELVEDYNLDFKSTSDSYPQVVYNVLFATVKEVALEWIEKINH